MANFEYYLQMYSRQRENRYQQAMELAYRDLMLEYKNELMARQALEEQIQLQQQLQSKLQLQFVKSLNDPQGLSPNQIAQLQLSYDKLNFESRKEISNRLREIQNDVEKEYETPKDLIGSMANNLPLFRGTESLNEIVRLFEDQKIIGKLATLTEKQKQEFAADYLPDLIAILPEKEIKVRGGDLETIKLLARTLGLGQYVSKSQIQRNKEKEIIEAQKETKNLLQVPSGLRKTATDIGISEEQLRNAIVTAFPTDRTDDVIVEPTLTDNIPLPTGDLLRARAAEYYAPFASEEFQQKVAAVKEPATIEEPVKPEVSKQQINQDALAGLPEYAGKMFRAAGAVAKIIDLDEDTFRDQATAPQKMAALLVPNIKQGRSNYETAVQQIEQEFDKPEEIEQALAVLGANMLREFRKQKITTPNLEDIASQPGRNK